MNAKTTKTTSDVNAQRDAMQKANAAEQFRRHSLLHTMTADGPLFVPLDKAHTFGLAPAGRGGAAHLDALESLGLMAALVPHATNPDTWGGYLVCRSSWAREQVGPDDAKFL